MENELKECCKMLKISESTIESIIEIMNPIFSKKVETIVKNRLLLSDNIIESMRDEITEYKKQLNEIQNQNIELESNLIKNVTLDNLDKALRMCNTELNLDTIALIVELVKLLEKKGTDLSIGDILEFERLEDIF